MTRGTISGGSATTVAAGAEALASGGNAIDAIVAACFATAVGEPTLTSLAGGGVLLHRDPSGKVTIGDFFANAPGLSGRVPDQRDFRQVRVDFGPAVQEFHIGAAAAAVPGILPGLCAAAQRWGRLPLHALVAPACRGLRDGVPLEAFGARDSALLAPILLSSASGRRRFSVSGRVIGEGDVIRCPELADTLEALARMGWHDYQAQVLAPALLQTCGTEAGGLLSREDLDHYEVRFQEPLVVEYRSHRVFLPGPPAAGGSMIANMLSFLEQVPASELQEGIARAQSLAAAMKLADEVRAVASNAEPGETVASPWQEKGDWHDRFARTRRDPLGGSNGSSRGRGSTTHISAIDDEGRCAGITFSYGEGNGQSVGNTGILMNNLMGEEDLFDAQVGIWPPGKRLATMMSPTLIESPASTGDHDLCVLGSGGANRIRTAIVQLISNLLDGTQPVEQAVQAPRLHFENGVLNYENLDDFANLPWQELGADRLVSFEPGNMFFGGTHVVRRGAEGEFTAAGDPRRGGTYRSVTD